MWHSMFVTNAYKQSEGHRKSPAVVQSQESDLKNPLCGIRAGARAAVSGRGGHEAGSLAGAMPHQEGRARPAKRKTPASGRPARLGRRSVTGHHQRAAVRQLTPPPRDRFSLRYPLLSQTNAPGRLCEWFTGHQATGFCPLVQPSVQSQ